MYMMMNNDGHSTLELAFLASKNNGAIKRHQKTVAAIRFDGLRMNRTGRTGSKRTAVERQIVQELNFELHNWEVEIMVAKAEQKKLDDEEAEAYAQQQNDDGMDDDCPECGRFQCRCDDQYTMADSFHGCPDCGCISCECGMYDSYDAYDGFDYHFGDDFYYTPRSFTPHNYVHMTEEEKMKLSDELWSDHEFYYGRNNLQTMTRSFGDEHYEHDFGDDYAFYGYDDEPVNEFGGLPNHFDSSFDYRTHFWAGDMYDWDCSVDMEDVDFTLKLSPMKARRASRFSEITGGKVKRVGRHGRTFSYHHLSNRCDDKGIQRAMDQTAEKRAHTRLLEELFGIEPKKAPKLRFKSMDEKVEYEAQQRKAAEREARKTNATKRGAAKSDNVDYSLPQRRMVTREVHVTRIGIVNGMRRVISDGVEQMRCRY